MRKKLSILLISILSLTLLGEEKIAKWEDLEIYQNELCYKEGKEPFGKGIIVKEDEFGKTEVQLLDKFKIRLWDRDKNLRLSLDEEKGNEVYLPNGQLIISYTQDKEMTYYLTGEKMKEAGKNSKVEYFINGEIKKSYEKKDGKITKINVSDNGDKTVTIIDEKKADEDNVEEYYCYRDGILREEKVKGGREERKFDEEGKIIYEKIVDGNKETVRKINNLTTISYFNSISVFEEIIEKIERDKSGKEIFYEKKEYIDGVLSNVEKRDKNGEETKYYDEWGYPSLEIQTKNGKTKKIVYEYGEPTEIDGEAIKYEKEFGDEIVKIYYPNKKLKSETIMKEDLTIIEEKVFSPKGELLVWEKLDENGEGGKRIEYNLEGKIRSEIEYSNFKKKSIKHSKYYYENGKIKYERIGESRIWYRKDGKKVREELVSKDEIINRDYYESGQLKVEGIKNGEGVKIVEYYSNGISKQNQHYTGAKSYEEVIEGDKVISRRYNIFGNLTNETIENLKDKSKIEREYREDKSLSKEAFYENESIFPKKEIEYYITQEKIITTLLEETEKNRKYKVEFYDMVGKKIKEYEKNVEGLFNEEKINVKFYFPVIFIPERRIMIY